MSKFGNFAFNESNRENNGYQTTEEMMKEFKDGLESFLSPWEDRLRKEFDSLKKNNETWKEGHNGKDCDAFVKKMWAISAPFDTVEIIDQLYVNRVKKDN